MFLPGVFRVFNSKGAQTMNHFQRFSDLKNEQVVELYKKSNCGDAERFFLFVELARRGLLERAKYILFVGHPDSYIVTPENSRVFFFAVLGLFVSWLFNLTGWSLLFLLLAVEGPLKLLIRKKISITPDCITVSLLFLRIFPLYKRSIDLTCDSIYITMDFIQGFSRHTVALSVYNVPFRDPILRIHLNPKLFLRLIGGLTHLMDYINTNYLLHYVPPIVFEVAGQPEEHPGKHNLDRFCQLVDMTKYSDNGRTKSHYDLNWLRLISLIQQNCINQEFADHNSELKEILTEDEDCIWVIHPNNFVYKLKKVKIIFTSKRILLINKSTIFESNYQDVWITQDNVMSGYRILMVGGAEYVYSTGAPYPIETLLSLFNRFESGEKHSNPYQNTGGNL